MHRHIIVAVRSVVVETGGIYRIEPAGSVFVDDDGAAGGFIYGGIAGDKHQFITHTALADVGGLF